MVTGPSPSTPAARILAQNPAGVDRLAGVVASRFTEGDSPKRRNEDLLGVGRRERWGSAWETRRPPRKCRVPGRTLYLVVSKLMVGISVSPNRSPSVLPALLSGPHLPDPHAHRDVQQEPAPTGCPTPSSTHASSCGPTSRLSTETAATGRE